TRWVSARPATAVIGSARAFAPPLRSIFLVADGSLSRCAPCPASHVSWLGGRRPVARRRTSRPVRQGCVGGLLVFSAGVDSRSGLPVNSDQAASQLVFD